MKERKIKGIIFISDVLKAMEHEWFTEYVDRSQFDIEFVLFKSKDSDLHNFIKAKKFKCTNYHLPAKYYIPFYMVFFAIKMFVRKPDFVHCHLFQATLIGVGASWLAGIKKRIYTRHHADVHHVYHPDAVKFDLWANKRATHIIAVSENIRTILMELEHVPSGKITVIRHGIPLHLIDKKIPPEQILVMRKKYDLENNYPIIGVISRFVPEKGIQDIIPAFRKLLGDYPNAKLILANAKGKYEPQVQTFLKELPSNSYLLVKFEPNINPLFKNFTVFVHAPIDPTCEAFGQVYIEALSLGVPMVCTLSGIATDLIKHERNALVANFKDPDSLYEQITRMLGDEALKNNIIVKGNQDVKEYTFEKKYEKIKMLYLE